jgi:hypothetical protein
VVVESDGFGTSLAQPTRGCAAAVGTSSCNPLLQIFQQQQQLRPPN